MVKQIKQVFEDAKQNFFASSTANALRASASTLVYSCIIEKKGNFTHLSHKISYTNLSKIVYIYTFATVIVHIYMVTVDVHPIILLISPFRTFFSLSSPCAKRTQSQTSPLLIFFFLRYTQTHPHTNTSIQTNQHRDTQTHPHTNKPTRTNQQRDRSA